MVVIICPFEDPSGSIRINSFSIIFSNYGITNFIYYSGTLLISGLSALISNNNQGVFSFYESGYLGVEITNLEITRKGDFIMRMVNEISQSNFQDTYYYYIGIKF